MSNSETNQATGQSSAQGADKASPSTNQAQDTVNSALAGPPGSTAAAYDTAHKNQAESEGLIPAGEVQVPADEAQLLAKTGLSGLPSEEFCAKLGAGAGSSTDAAGSKTVAAGTVAAGANNAADSSHALLGGNPNANATDTAATRPTQATEPSSTDQGKQQLQNQAGATLPSV